MPIVNVSLDVLDHDDRIVHDEARRQRDAEERQRVDREAEELHERERADERHGNRDRRNERRPPVLKEEEHDEHDEPDRFSQRRDDFSNRFRHDARRVERDLDLHARREALREPIDFGRDVAVHLQRVGGRQLEDAEADGVAPVESRRRRIAFGAQLGPADIANADERAVRRSLEDDVLELRGIVQPSFRAYADLIGVSLRAPDSAPTAPAATCTFCSRSACTTSSAVMLRPASLSGSTHSRIA